MENTTNRNDVIKFFKDMPESMQMEVIKKIQQQIKKPPDTSTNQSESEVIHISQLCVK